MLGVKKRIKRFVDNIYIPFIWLQNVVNIIHSTDNCKILYNIFKVIKSIGDNSLVLCKYNDILQLSSISSIALHEIESSICELNNFEILVPRNNNKIILRVYNNNCNVYKYSYYDSIMYTYITKTFKKPDHLFYDMNRNIDVQFNQLVI